MICMGGKTRIAKYILPFMKEYLNGSNYFVDAFCGGCGLIDKLNYPKRIANDINPYVIEAMKLIQSNPQSIPDLITETYYKDLKSQKKQDGITGFVAFTMSFGGKFFGGYARRKAGAHGCIESMKAQTRRAKQAAIAQQPLLKDVLFSNKSYTDLAIPPNSVIYCDSPYQGTTGYNGAKFNHDEFWQWCRDMTKQGHKVFVSEYQAPEDFTCLWEKQISNSINTTKTYKPIEKLFTI